MQHRKVSYVNGRYVPHEHAMVHIEDRGYQFSDGVYEVMALEKGKLLDDDLHYSRLKRSLDGISVAMPVSVPVLNSVIRELSRVNKINSGYIYIQVTRGVAPRNHSFPKGNIRPSLVVSFVHPKPPTEKEYENGVDVITGDDIRWFRRDIKSISLLPNVLSKQDAIKAGVKEIWFIDKVTGFITEGSSTNAYIIDKSGTILTHPANEYILGGVTRDSVLKEARKAGIKIEERPFTLAEAEGAAEAFLTSTTSWVLPVVKMNGKKIADGKPGKITKKLIELYSSYVASNLNKNDKN